MMRAWIAVAVVCLVMDVPRGVSAQETPDDGAPASVEMSLSVAPIGLLSLAAINFGSGSGMGALGGLGLVQPTLDFGFAVDSRLLLVAGLGMTGSSQGTVELVQIGLPLSLLWYLETPRVGHVMPMLRVGINLAYDHYALGTDSESWAVGALARGGITWLADRCIGIRAEVGLRGGMRVSETDPGAYGSLGLDALVGVVLRV